MTEPLRTGAFVGSEVESFSRADAMEQWQGTGLDVQNVFTTWDTATDPLHGIFDRQLRAIRDAGRTPMLTWEPFTDGPEETPADVASRIVAGEHDDYLARFSRALDEWLNEGEDRRLFLRFAHEPNGDWYPWAPAAGGVGSADAYADMWRYVRDAVGADDRVTWVWAPNHVDVGEHTAESLYPGEAYVDWVGVDGFNWGATEPWSTWQSPCEVFEDMLARVDALGDHPVCIPEYASTSVTADGHNVAAKNRWIREFFAYVRDSPVELAVWFNIDKETDWAVFDADRGDTVVTIGEERYTAYSAYGREAGR
ncbi:glycoside hydrolase family 26 protein [Salarchaeum japonicum]|uniref:glycoside hydrolase family 26 protein n=1 Tax=Salarchaeum japonicum TaxID=555573 RepID=UPI003C75B102